MLGKATGVLANLDACVARTREEKVRKLRGPSEDTTLPFLSAPYLNRYATGSRSVLKAITTWKYLR